MRTVVALTPARVEILKRDETVRPGETGTVILYSQTEDRGLDVLGCIVDGELRWYPVHWVRWTE